MKKFRESTFRCSALENINSVSRECQGLFQERAELECSFEEFLDEIRNEAMGYTEKYSEYISILRDYQRIKGEVELRREQASTAIVSYERSVSELIEDVQIVNQRLSEQSCCDCKTPEFYFEPTELEPIPGCDANSEQLTSIRSSRKRR